MKTTTGSLLKNIIIEAYEGGALIDANGKKISTGRFVKRKEDNGDRGTIVGVTDRLLIRVKWHYSKNPMLQGKETQEPAENLIIIQ